MSKNLIIEATHSVLDNNVKKVTVKVYVMGNGFSWNKNAHGSVSINGALYNFTHSLERSRTKQLLFTRTITVPANKDRIVIQATFRTEVSMGNLNSRLIYTLK